MKTLIFKIIRKTTVLLETVSPRLTHWWISWLFFSPRVTRRKIPDIENMEQTWLSFETIDGQGGRCRLYSAGDGPTVLLIHGWEGSAHS